MQANAATELRDWIGQIESALGVIISATDEGAFSLYTRGDRAILIEPVRGQLALVLTGALSETDETMSANLFRALLAANVVPGMAYPSSIGLHPAEQTLILRLLWAPAQDDWRARPFLSCLRPLACRSMRWPAPSPAARSRAARAGEDLPEPALSDEVQQFI